VDQVQVLAFAIERVLSGYDAGFLALALRLNSPVITDDAAFRRKAGHPAYSLAEYLARHDRFSVSDAPLTAYGKKAPRPRRARS